MDPREVPEIRKIAQRTTSLETPVGDEGDAELGDFIQSEGTPDPADLVSSIMANESLDRALKAMDERERKVVELRFGLKGEHPRTLAEVSARFNVSRERIRQIEAGALEKLKGALEIQALAEWG
jgi:RNA polymerase primary sigma factor